MWISSRKTSHHTTRYSIINADTGGYAFFDNSTPDQDISFEGTGTIGFAIIETRGDANGQDVFIAKR